MIKITSLAGVWEVENLDDKIRADGKLEKILIEKDGRRWIIHLKQPVELVLVSGSLNPDKTEEYK